MVNNFKLTYELIPLTSWFANIRTAMPRKKWDILRRQVYTDYGYRCGICTNQGRLSCHEIWSYDDINHIQKLIGFIALCDNCHSVKHMGFSNIRAKQGQLDMSIIEAHFMGVNNCSKEDFEKYNEIAFQQWEERSKYSWNVDLGKYKEMLEV